MLQIPDTWIWFTIAFGVMLLATLIMKRQGSYFYTVHMVVRKFTMLDLEFATSQKELGKIIKGIHDLSGPDRKKSLFPQSSEVISKLKGQLWVDLLLYMPAVYGGIFLLCMKVSHTLNMYELKTLSGFYFVLAWIQLLAFALDILENFYLFHVINSSGRENDKTSAASAFLFTDTSFKVLETVKWGTALIAAVCGLFALIYFWLAGFYTAGSQKYVWVIAGEIILFIILSVVSQKYTKQFGKE